jgi:hypothetical protein
MIRMPKRVVVAGVAAIVAATLSPTTLADGTEQLGPPVGVTIAVGTGVVAAGVGMEQYPNLPNSFNVQVPPNAAVKQVLLYWSGHWTNVEEPFFIPQVDGDSEIRINGIPVNGTKIGGSTRFFASEWFVTYRADITLLAVVQPGASTLTIDEMFFQSFEGGNDGAAVIVIYDDGGPPADIDIRDGLDLAFLFFPPPLDQTVAQTFTFAPNLTENRTANLATLAASVSDADGGPRPNQLRIAFAPGGESIVVDNPWQSNDGHQFDALNTPITIPMGASSMTVQAISGPPEGGYPASLGWIGAGLSIANTAPVEQWADETAVGAGTRYPDTKNWFTYTPYTTNKVDLIAGQHFDAGDIFMSRSGSTTSIRIVLHDGYRWADVEENLKIQPFASAPTAWMPPGGFLHKFTVSGNTVTVQLPGTTAKFYGIHGDVERLLTQ